MTDMRQVKSIFRMPNQNDENAITAHRDAVLAQFGDLFQEIETSLRAALPKVKSTFELHEGPVDLSVHAPLTRYLVRQDLQKKSQLVFDQDEVEFNMLRVSNCGLCVRTQYGDIRVLKSPNEGMPKALSDARVRFITNNQLVLSFAEEVSPQLLSLNLFALWRMDADHQYVGLDIACPRKTRDRGDVDCYWITRWGGAEVSMSALPASQLEPDLEGIVALPQQDEKQSGR